MEEKKLYNFSQKYLKKELSEYQIKETVFFYENEYIKILNSKRHKFNNILSKYLYKENFQIRNLRKVSKICKELSIDIYEISGMISVENKNFYYGFYSAKKVEGCPYHELEKSIEVYREAFTKYIKMLKSGIYEYDFRAHNFLITKDKKIVFIDFDESVVKRSNKKSLYKSLSLLAKNFKGECEAYGLDWEVYKKEALDIIEKELNIPKEKIEKRVKLLLNYREFMKKFRNNKRRIKSK